MAILLVWKKHTLGGVVNMKYKVIDYISNDSAEVETGTCELCFGTSVQNNDVLVLEDEKGNRLEVELNDWDWGDLTNYYIDNVVDFSDWLSKQEFEKELDCFDILNLVDWYSCDEEDSL